MRASEPEESPLVDAAERLYPLAHLLIGADKAGTLIRHAVRRGAECPPSKRPDDIEGWLLGLLLDAYREQSPSESGLRTESEPQAPHFPRQTVAQNLIQYALPSALAACSPRNRFLFALAALRTTTDGDQNAFAQPLSSTSETHRTLRSQALMSLRRRLHEALTPTERKVVDETMTEETVLRAVHDVLNEQLPSPPSTLQPQLQHLVEDNRPPDELTEAASSESGFSLFRTDRSARMGAGLLVVGLLIIALGAGLFGASYFSQPSGSPQGQPDLVAFSTQRAGSLSPARSTHDPAEASAYVESIWNRRFAIPYIKGGRLHGVGRFQVTDTVETPVLLYRDTTTTSRVAVFVYSYALLDRMENRTTLSSSMREQLARSMHLVAPVDSSRQAALWRHRDNIFVAVTPSDGPDNLQKRLRLRN